MKPPRNTNPAAPIVFDMDNVLIDETGATLRPGILDILQSLHRAGQPIVVWTSSTRARAAKILADHGIRPLLSKLITREQYDPENLGLAKQVWTLKPRLFIDDDPFQISMNRQAGVNCVQMAAYRKNTPLPPDDLKALRKAISAL